MNPDQIWEYIKDQAKTRELDFDNEIDNFRLKTLLVIDGLYTDDIAWKLGARKSFSGIFIWFLILQNFLVFLFIFSSYYVSVLSGSNSFFKLQPIFSVLITGTIIQTIMVIRIMVRWIFSDTKYKMPPKLNKDKPVI